MTTAPAMYHLQYDSQRLLLMRDEVQWTARLDTTPQRADVVVNFGCGQQLTPHLMLETVDVLAALGLTVAAVAGSQWCCGMAVEEDDGDAAMKVVRGSVRRMAQFEPQTTVHACGAWWPQTAKLRALGETVPFDLAYMPGYVRNALERRADDIEWRTAETTPVLLHLKSKEVDPETLAERASSVGVVDASVTAILELIPSVDIVAEVEAPTLGAPCAEGPDDELVLDGASAEEREGVRAELAEQADRMGAHVLVCAHHQCSREWGKFASERLAVRHYISVLADAMGLARPDRYHTCWALPTLDDIVDETRPAWESWDLGRAEALSLATEIFPSHPRA